MMIGDGRETYAYNTLKSMRKEELISVIRCLEKNLINAHEMNSNQFKLLMEKEVYAWHNLHKNPEDLPGTTRQVIIAYEDFEEKSGYKYYDVAFLGVGDLWYSAEVDNFEYHDEGFLVIAWREIEPFEEEVE